MGQRIVRMTGELFQELLTEGRTFPDAAGKVLKVTKGLPEGARLVGLSHDRYFTTYGQWALKFEHPSWPDGRPGDAIPELRVEFGVESPDPALFVARDLPAADVEHLRRELARSPGGRVVVMPVAPEVLCRPELGGIAAFDAAAPAPPGDEPPPPAPDAVRFREFL